VGLVNRVLYFLSGFGHSAVIIFFVLSGFFIVGSVARDVSADRFSWFRFVTARGTRLYLVLLPGLVLTMFWDWAGARQIADHAMDNADTAVAIIDRATIAEHSSWSVWLGNVLFLQTIVVPAYGSNTALWSLANEFWYYLLFPCLWLIWQRRGTLRQRVGYLLLAGGILWLVGWNIAIYFLIWMFGGVVALMPHSSRLNSASRSRIACALSLAVLLLVLAWIRLRPLGNVLAQDVVLGIACAVLVYCLLHRTAPSNRSVVARFSRELAGFSYSLYVLHLPLLVFLRACWTSQQAWRPDALHWFFVAASMGMVILYAYGLSRVTEAHTDRLRQWIQTRYLTRRKVPRKVTENIVDSTVKGSPICQSLPVSAVRN
jgi:peptidoglycan/LPS O-acetylase OafA/YrhL